MQKRFQKVYIEISNICNFQCHFCPEVLRPKKSMELDQLETILTQISPLTEQVCYHLMGEPLYHKNFITFVEKAKKHNVKLNITTNGSLLNTENAKALLLNHIEQINFSLHSFEANFPKADIKTYLNKIFNFTANALELRPDLYINFRLWNITDTEKISLATQMIYQEIEKKFNVKINKQVDVGWKKSKKIKNKLYLHFDSRFEWPSLGLPFISEQGSCYGLKSHFGILTDGTLVPCCLDKEGVINLGNVYEQSIEEILNSPRAQKIFNGFKKSKREEELCQKCSFINRFNKSLQKSEVKSKHII